jgi:hypothetical protein
VLSPALITYWMPAGGIFFPLRTGIPQQPAKLCPGAVQSRCNGSGSDFQNVRDLVVSEPLLVAQDEDCPVLFRQMLQRIVDLLPRRLGFRPRGILLLLAHDAQVPSFCISFSEELQGLVRRDAVQPGTHPRPTIEAVNSLEGPDERLLGDVERILLVSRQPQRDAVDAIRMALVHRPLCLSVATTAARDELGFFHRNMVRACTNAASAFGLDRSSQPI